MTRPSRRSWPLPEFYAANDAGSKNEIDKAITGLNLKARDFSASQSFTKDYLDLIGQAELQVRQTQWVEAHKTIWEATFLLNRALESQAAGKFRKWMGGIMWAGCCCWWELDPG